MLFGAAIGSIFKNPVLAIFLALSSHYFLDLFPHIEYPIENIKNKQWRRSFWDLAKAIADFCLGIILIFIFSDNRPVIYICAFFAILPDGFTFLNYIFSNKILEMQYNLHEKIHFLKHKKIPVFWRFLSQVLAVIISIIILQA
jgi:hypothetical protein